MKNQKKVCIVTGTRAEYGLLKPVMKLLAEEPKINLQIIATGSHLSRSLGLTYQEIEADGFQIDQKMDILLDSSSQVGVVKAMGLAMISVADILKELNPDLLLVLGDRYEIFAVVSAAYVLGIPIAHISGGEISEGALDDGFRHSISKMSSLHFTANTEYRKRVIQLGEQPDTVYAVGDTGVENAVNLEKMSKSELAKDLDFPIEKPFFLFTYHPVTQGIEDSLQAIREILMAFSHFPSISVLMTKANADAGGNKINQLLQEYANKSPNQAKLYDSLGRLRYLSALSYCTAMVGNSSSGLVEAPALKVPTINIGNRQKGRMRASSVIDCQPNQAEIITALNKALSTEFQTQLAHIHNPYGEGQQVSQQIKEIIMKFLSQTSKTTKKFYDIPFEI